MARRFWSVFGRALMVLALGELLAAAGPARAQTPALVSVSPEYQLAHLGDTFSVQVRIDDVQALYGFGWQIIDNDAGTVNLVNTQINPAEPASGSGALFTVVFRADAEGATAALLLSKVELTDRDGQLIPCDTRGGAVRLGDYQLFLPAAFR